MLITKTPLRVSFAGGGTDLESFYKHYNTPGCVVSCSIDKYIYQLIKNNFFDGSIISYSQVEKISKNSETGPFFNSFIRRANQVCSTQTFHTTRQTPWICFQSDVMEAKFQNQEI